MFCEVIDEVNSEVDGRTVAIAGPFGFASGLTVGGGVLRFAVRIAVLETETLGGVGFSGRAVVALDPLSI